MATSARSSYILAFAALYIVWGSTYFAMRILVAEVPPFAGASVRFLIAGGLPLLWLRLRGARAPSWVEWRDAAVTGAGLFLGGNGIVMWCEQHVSSGLAALVIGCAPVWFALFDWLRPGGTAPVLRAWIGILTGLVGLAILINPGSSVAAGLDPLHLGALVLGSICWVFGSLYSRHRPKHPSPWMASAQAMVSGGVGLAVVALLTGEHSRLATLSPSRDALLALGYLVVFGSWVGFGAYAWLLPRVSPARLSTYAYVNPVVALLLGALFLAEPLSLRVGCAAAVILLSVAVVQRSSSPKIKT